MWNRPPIPLKIYVVYDGVRYCKRSDETNRLSQSQMCVANGDQSMPAQVNLLINPNNLGNNNSILYLYKRVSNLLHNTA